MARSIQGRWRRGPWGNRAFREGSGSSDRRLPGHIPSLPNRVGGVLRRARREPWDRSRSGRGCSAWSWGGSPPRSTTGAMRGLSRARVSTIPRTGRWTNAGGDGPSPWRAADRAIPSWRASLRRRPGAGDGRTGRSSRWRPTAPTGSSSNSRRGRTPSDRRGWPRRPADGRRSGRSSGRVSMPGGTAHPVEEFLPAAGGDRDGIRRSRSPSGSREADRSGLPMPRRPGPRRSARGPGAPVTARRPVAGAVVAAFLSLGIRGRVRRI